MAGQEISTSQTVPIGNIQFCGFMSMRTLRTSACLHSFSLNIDAYIILKEISPGISLEGMLLKLKLQYFGHLIRRADSLEKTLMLGGTGGRRRRGRPRMRWLDGITELMDIEPE